MGMMIGRIADGSLVFYPEEWKSAFLTVDENLRKDEWIPVTDHLPNPNEFEGNVRKYYLVQNEYTDMMVAYYDGTHWNQMYHTGYIKEEIKNKLSSKIVTVNRKSVLDIEKALKEYQELMN